MPLNQNELPPKPEPAFPEYAALLNLKQALLENNLRELKHLEEVKAIIIELMSKSVNPELITALINVSRAINLLLTDQQQLTAQQPTASFVN